MIYADEMTDSVRNAVQITNKRRKMQLQYNKDHGICLLYTSMLEIAGY